MRVIVWVVLALLGTPLASASPGDALTPAAPPTGGAVGTSTSTTTTVTEPTTTSTTSTTDTNASTTSTTSSSSTTSTTTVTATTTTSTTTTPPGGERCDNAADDDGDGRVDYADDDCCTPPVLELGVKKARIKGLGAGSRLRLRGTVPPPGDASPAGHDVVLQVSAADGSPAFCAEIPSARIAAKGKRWVFKDRTRTVAAAKGVDKVVLRHATAGLAVQAKGKQTGLGLPALNEVEVTLAMRAGDVATCARRVLTFRRGDGVVRYP